MFDLNAMYDCDIISEMSFVCDSVRSSDYHDDTVHVVKVLYLLKSADGQIARTKW
jgi:hypothetical protein